jgi:hypothetical protein
MVPLLLSVVWFGSIPHPLAKKDKPHQLHRENKDLEAEGGECVRCS